MNWIGAIMGLALVALAVAIISDLELTVCTEGSFYATVHLLCTPKRH
jgi:hypothetical protein